MTGGRAIAGTLHANFRPMVSMLSMGNVERLVERMPGSARRTVLGCFDAVQILSQIRDALNRVADFSRIEG